MPHRALELDDLATPIVTSGIRSPRRRKHCRFLDNPYCYPYCGAPRCVSSSPCRRRCRDYHPVSKRGLKSGRVVCDTFSSVCYPRNMANYCSYRNPRRPYSCSPKRCFRSITPPILCENGICRGVCKCRPSSPVCRPHSPCSQAGDVLCDQDRATNFVDAMNTIGTLSSRYEPHLCPWEADVTVSGTIKAHCTSTADEISERLAGPFKAFGRRYTTDAEYNDWRETRNQKLTLGQLDDGGMLDFSKNNRPTMPDDIEFRVKRIVGSPREPRPQKPSYHKSTKEGHIHWDKHINNDDLYETEKRYSPRNRHDKYRDDKYRDDKYRDDKRYHTTKDFGSNSESFGGFKIMGINKRSSANNKKSESSYKENRYLTSDSEREDIDYRHTKGRSSRDWQKFEDNNSDDEGYDDRERYYTRDNYKPSRKYSGAETKGDNSNYGEKYRFHRYNFGGADRERETERERRYRDVYEGDTRWARRDSDREGKGKGEGIRFWPR